MLKTDLPTVIVTGASSGVGLYATQPLSEQPISRERAAMLWTLSEQLTDSASI